MVLRPKLVVAPADVQLVERLEDLAIQICAKVERGSAADSLLAEVHALTGDYGYDAAHFRILYGASSPREFAEKAALGVPPTVLDVSREEVVELVDIVLRNETPHSHKMYYLQLLDRALPNAEISDLLYWPDRERTIEEIADEALFRCDLWRRGGLGALRAHLWDLAREVLANPSAPLWAQTWARSHVR